MVELSIILIAVPSPSEVIISSGFAPGTSKAIVVSNPNPKSGLISKAATFAPLIPTSS